MSAKDSARPPKRSTRRVSLDFSNSISRTEQAHKDDCRIQNILKKYRETGRLEHTAKYEGTYGDFANAPDYQEAQEIIASAKSMFETVPASIRQKFDNKPEKYVEFMQNPKNRVEIEDMGLSTTHLPPWEAPQDNPAPNPSTITTPKPGTPPEATPEPSA